MKEAQFRQSVIVIENNENSDQRGNSNINIDNGGDGDDTSQKYSQLLRKIVKQTK